VGLQGKYADGPAYELPKGWRPVGQGVLDAAQARARLALDLGGGLPLPAFERMRRYYEPSSSYAGAMFTTVGPNDDFYIGAADLWAVSTLSMERFVTPLLGRRLMLPGTVHTTVARQLRRLPTFLPITDLTADVLTAMEDLYTTLRTVMSDNGSASNWWVFASKMCARKRPDLFPVRDNKVCEFLAAEHGVGRKPEQLGTFQTDIQVYAYLATTGDISARLRQPFEDLARSDVGFDRAGRTAPARRCALDGCCQRKPERIDAAPSSRRSGRISRC